MKRVRSLLILMALLGATLAPARAQSGTIYFTRYFPETQHNLMLPFLYAWDSWGGLPVFGYARSELFMERNADLDKFFATQYFERNRLEHHPETDWPYRVLLGRLGDEILKRQGRDWQTFPKASPSAPHYVPETGHAIADVFWPYWSSHGLDFGEPGVSFRESLALWGLPLSEPGMETNSSGDTVLTQWFERARFEYHPNNPNPYKVLLGLLGNELIAGRQGEADFQPRPELDIPHAAAKRLAIAEAQFLERPLAYREDIQGIVDQGASDWNRVWNEGGNDRAVLEELDRTLKAQIPTAKWVYAAQDMALSAGCRNIDSRDPLKNAQGAAWSPVFQAVTFGVTGVYTGACGPAISIVIVGIY